MHNKNKQSKSTKFSDETMQSLIGLGDVLLKIHLRLLSEGYDVINKRSVQPGSRKAVGLEEVNNKAPSYRGFIISEEDNG